MSLLRDLLAFGRPLSHGSCVRPHEVTFNKCRWILTVTMFSLLLLTHGRQIAVARLETLRHREPFVRLAVLKARPPDSKRLPRGLIGEFLPLLICCSLEGWQQASTCHAQVVESGGHEHGARSGDLEAHQTLPAASPGTGGGQRLQERLQSFQHQPATSRISLLQHNCFPTCPTRGRIRSTAADENTNTICRIVYSEAQDQS
ncbi:hypothetical protein F5882DRAFT_84693 [Hyaloscypha sp. PMI_1271]|nr:hypothetical protein F5882DRAFT_84693 [Hyaloscypha sp. PMI_1271]